MQPAHTHWRARLLRWATCAALLLTPAIAWASDTAAHGEVPWFKLWYIQLAGSIVNFAILVWVLVRFGGPKLTMFLKNRKVTIEKAMKEAAELREQAQNALADIERKTASLDAERAQILEEYRQMGQTERARIVAEAEAQATRIREEARLAAETETKRARQRLEKELMVEALVLAEKALRERISANEQRTLIDQAIGSLETMANETAAR